MPLLDIPTLANRLNNQAIADPTQYPAAYVNALIQDVTDEITWYLHFNPALTVYTNEEGPVTLVESGNFAGRYMVELKNYPLPTDDFTQVASAWIPSFKLTYALALTVPTDVSLSYVKVQHRTGQMFCLAPGAVEALTAAFFGMAPLMNSIYAVGYSISYTAGYATGINDPLNPSTNQPWNVPPLPEDIRQAAVLLCRERIAYDAWGNKNMAMPMAGMLQRERVGEREEAYRPLMRGQREGPVCLGYGGPLAAAAQAKLEKHRKQRNVVFVP